MRWIRRLLWGLGALLLLWAAAWLAVPALVQWQLPAQLGERLGRTVTLGGASFAPWDLRLTLDQLAIGGPPGGAEASPQFSVARLEIDADARSLLRLAPVVESLKITSPRLRVARTGEGRYDVDDVLQRFAAEPRPAPSDPPRFALHEVTVTDGEVVFDDQPIRTQHRISGLTLSLPFVSSLVAHTETPVEPRLAFDLGGAHYDAAARAVPFAPSRSGTMTLRVAGLDVGPFLGYLPESLPVRLQRGRVDADLSVKFAAAEKAAPSLAVSGKLALSDVALAERSGKPLLAVQQLSLALDDVQPLARKVALGALRVEGLELHLDRDANGVVGLQRLGAANDAGSTATSTASAEAPAWQVSLASLELGAGRVLWNDAAVQPAAAWALDGIAASAQQLRWPATEATPFRLQATLRPQADAAASLGVLSVQGQASDAAASAHIDLSGLSVAAIAPYANTAKRVRVEGVGKIDGEFEWAAASESRPMQLQLRLDEVAIDGLRLDEPPSRPTSPSDATVAAKRVQLNKVGIDLATQSVAIGSARLQQPEVRLERTPDGQWNVARLAGPTPLEESNRPLVRAAAEATWQVRLDDLALDGGRVTVVDARPAPGHVDAPVRLGIEALKVGLRDLRLRGERLVSTPQLSLNARIVDQVPGRAREQPGLVEWRGRFGVEPLLLAGRLRAERLAVDAVQAYVAHPLSARLDRAEAGFQGAVALREVAAGGLQLDVKGDALLSDLKVVSVERPGGTKRTPADRELLTWQSLAVNGLGVELRPGAPPKLSARDATLSDFFARVVLTEEGELNLRDAAPPRPAPAAASGAAAAVLPAAAAASAPAAPAAARLPLEFELGGLRLVNGRVDYSDRFVKPNYSAALTDLNGEVGAVHTGLAEPAAVHVTGRVAGTGLLEIDGRINPKAAPRELDVRAKASDVELAPLSAYSGKYAGYAIERGKLSVEVHYTIDPGGRLEASHQLVLNQLTFGERVDSPSATKLPVLLAVALLKDRNGVIDINLPVSGTLDDPQFSLGPIIWQVIGNLIAKAATAPFALLTGGGGPETSHVAFEPGTAQFSASGAAVIDQVARALADRPALKMTVVGEADIDLERDAYQRAVVEQRLQREQRREQLRASGVAPAAQGAPPVALAPDERARLVKLVYRDTDLPDKPRNLIGLKADIPPDEMEALLRANVRASPEAMRELALQRGLTVRESLIAKGLPGDRLFVGDPKLRSGGSSDNDKTWTPRVKLTLDTH